ncbi:hypothetical protein NY607_06965 [Lysinibacillus sp. A4]|uniref:hypothetical protein n=1 Tax=unclassified Lysinibacillus TaxID=2636778 RepID=UPI001EDB3427|nr:MULTISPECIES: hypothetical protein [unclassified Lysinibacillus]MCS5500864.1 hypothetical protein [Lysinibacillus sp. A4]UKJ44279.1 hypothetical protein L6W14_16130 [Lysinibacillus sp. ACHW1.5]
MKTESAKIFVKREYDNEDHEYYVVIDDVKIFDLNKNEIKNKEITNHFINEKTYDTTDIVLVELVANGLNIDESDVKLEYI